MVFKDSIRCTFSIILISVAMPSIADNSTITRASISPIVINTVAQHYVNPTLEQYTRCTQRRDQCINNCDGNRKCEEKCQICPILIDQDILVQGINDTLYTLPISVSKVNQTNIIRLTNEIRNIIRTSLGNITAHTQNNITVYHKASKSGGKFGLGYTEKGPCCHLLEPQRCRSSPNGPICTHRRQETCGSHCISRVMRAKRVVTCSETDSENCTQSIEYIPQPRRAGCQYIPKWPFISCKTGAQMQNSGSRHKSTCGRCFEIPYLNIIRGQVPRACFSCFGRITGRSTSPVHPQPYYSGYMHNPAVIPYSPYQPYQFTPPQPLYYDNNVGNIWNDELNEMPSLDGDFQIEGQKCINEDGTAVENCIEEESPLRFNIKTNTREENDEESILYDVLDFDSNEQEITGPVYRRRRGIK